MYKLVNTMYITSIKQHATNLFCQPHSLKHLKNLNYNDAVIQIYFFSTAAHTSPSVPSVQQHQHTQYQFNISFFHNMYCSGLKMNELIFYWIVISSIFRTCLSSGPTTERLKMKFSLTHSSTRSQRRRNGTAPTVMWRTV